MRSLEQPVLEGHQQRLERIRPDGHAAVEAPEAGVHPLLARGPVCKRELDFPGGSRRVTQTRMRVPVGTVIEDLDQKSSALSRMVREQVDPRAAEGTGREEIVAQVFLDAEVKVNVDG